MGSISSAASVLGYTQSAVSQQLAALERATGTALVDRTQRPLRPTPAGAALRPHVDRVLAALGGADAAVTALRAGTPRVRLAAFASALSSFVPTAVRDLRRQHPQLLVQVLQLETHDAVERLSHGELDVAIVHHLGASQTTAFARRSLLVDHLHVVVPAGHRLARQETISLTDLDGEPLILPGHDTPDAAFRSLIEHLCAQAGFGPQVAYELDDLPAVQAFVAAGIAIVPMHGLTLATLPPGATTRPLAERPAGSRVVEALAPPTARTPVIDELIAHFERAARAYAARD